MIATIVVIACIVLLVVIKTTQEKTPTENTTIPFETNQDAKPPQGASAAPAEESDSTSASSNNTKTEFKPLNITNGIALIKKENFDAFKQQLNDTEKADLKAQINTEINKSSTNYCSKADNAIQTQIFTGLGLDIKPCAGATKNNLNALVTLINNKAQSIVTHNTQKSPTK